MAKSKKFDYSEWYQKVGKERRRKRYAADKAYREECRKRARDYYNDNKKVDSPKEKKHFVDGSGRDFFTIGHLAEKLSRNILTIRAYHRNNVLPDPLYYDSKGWRLYSPNQIDLLIETFKKFDDGELQSLAQVSEILHERWEE